MAISKLSGDDSSSSNSSNPNEPTVKSNGQPPNPSSSKNKIDDSKNDNKRKGMGQHSVGTGTKTKAPSPKIQDQKHKELGVGQKAVGQTADPPKIQTKDSIKDHGSHGGATPKTNNQKGIGQVTAYNLPKNPTKDPSRDHGSHAGATPKPNIQKGIGQGTDYYPPKNPTESPSEVDTSKLGNEVDHMKGGDTTKLKSEGIGQHEGPKIPTKASIKEKHEKSTPNGKTSDKGGDFSQNSDDHSGASTARPGK